ncbi:MAG: Preprotein translocase subunit SecD [Parcubacteria group bacterium GW2011_GWF2_46_8]|nr:MAG: Preprotein translocase subunit SecD [Parcubacteria group bacterium GW2011_GWF1_45_5]KKU47696.1 MAG: Preprotein translocase subunit SecD [Parcubacteria group bacterium GW2011_GWF2_46_8]
MISVLIQEKKKAFALIAAIFVLAIGATVFAFPGLVNTGISWVSGKIGVSAPSFHVPGFRLGLDVSGGTSLIYRADVAGLSNNDRITALDGLKDVIERRINLFGVQEPRIEVSRSGDEWRLIVELAGIKDIAQAIEMIGQTPFLQFWQEQAGKSSEELFEKYKPEETLLHFEEYFEATELTGRFLKRAEVVFDQTSSIPAVSLVFDEEGAKVFKDLTTKNLNKPLAITIDGIPLSAPIVGDVITDGHAQITGRFSLAQAKDLANNLNQGALPVPITLISQRSVGATLGNDSLNKMVYAGIIGFITIAVFMVLSYRLGGLFSVVALLIYIPLTLAIFKLVGVTLTLSGIAGFLLSMGMAVDANILILERIKEELRSGKEVVHAIREGFLRAWPSIRDSNVSSIITALVLYFFTASIVRGFALTLLIGVVTSMFSAIFVSRTLIMAFLGEKSGHSKFWFGVRMKEMEDSKVSPVI